MGRRRYITEESDSEEINSIEEALEMSDEDLLWYDENDWSEVCVTKVDGGSRYEGEFSIWGINVEGTEHKNLLGVDAEVEYSYEMFVFPTDVTDLMIRQKESDNETITGDESGTVVAVGENTSNDYLYYGNSDTTYRPLTNMDGIRLYVLPYPIEKIYSCAFSDATALERVVLSDSMIYIGDCAFSNCTNLKRINLPSSIEEIEKSAFQNCPNLVAYVDEGSYADAYCKENGIQTEYTGNVVTNEFGLSDYEFTQLPKWKQILCNLISQKFGDDRESYLFDLVYVDDDEDAELVAYKKDSGDFNKMLLIYYVTKTAAADTSSSLQTLISSDELDSVFKRDVYIIERNNQILSVTNENNTNPGAKDGQTCDYYSLRGIGDSVLACIIYEADGTQIVGESSEKNYNYIKENFDMDKAKKLSESSLVSYDEIIARIIQE